MASKTCAIGSKTFDAPKGWKFHDCNPRFISMIEVNAVSGGDWSADLRKATSELVTGSNDRPEHARVKNNYITAEPGEKGTWKILFYDHGGIYGSYGIEQHVIKAPSRAKVIKEMECLAAASEEFENEYIFAGTDEEHGDPWEYADDHARANLGGCRKKNGIEFVQQPVSLVRPEDLPGMERLRTRPFVPMPWENRYKS